MERRNFLKLAATASIASVIPSMAFANNIYGDQKTKNELAYHKIKDIKFKVAQLKYPRLVGKNSRLGHHGTGPNLTFCILTTDNVAEGIVLMMVTAKLRKAFFQLLKEKVLLICSHQLLVH